MLWDRSRNRLLNILSRCHWNRKIADYITYRRLRPLQPLKKKDHRYDLDRENAKSLQQDHLCV